MFEFPLSFTTIYVNKLALGDDIVLTIWGGEKPHIGCTVLAIPRLSLTGSGETSATASVLNAVGHKDEFVCRKIAEAVCAAKNTKVVCTGGIHMDDATPEQIKEIMDVIDQIIRTVIDLID